MFSVLTSKIFGAAVIALAVLLTITTNDRDQWRAAARKSDATLAAVRVAEKQATIAAQAAHDAQEQRYKDLANDADKDHAAALADAGTATDSWIAAHRVPVCPAGGAASGSAQGAGGGSASVPASVPADGFVAVSDADVQACAGAVAYGVAAHDWAMGLNP